MPGLITFVANLKTAQPVKLESAEIKAWKPFKDNGSTKLLGVPNSCLFYSRPAPGDETHFWHCLDDQEPKTRQSRDLG